jgi:hypothetical protein
MGHPVVMLKSNEISGHAICRPKVEKKGIVHSSIKKKANVKC